MAKVMGLNLALVTNAHAIGAAIAVAGPRVLLSKDSGLRRKGLGRGNAPLLMSRSAVNFSLGGETREHSHPRVLPQLATVLRLM
jgi:hypothetical protein